MTATAIARTNAIVLMCTSNSKPSPVDVAEVDWAAPPLLIPVLLPPGLRGRSPEEVPLLAVLFESAAVLSSMTIQFRTRAVPFKTATI